jgi:hypothetical protein
MWKVCRDGARRSCDFPIILPAELDGVFTQPPTFIHFHEVMEQLEPAFKEIVTILRQEGPTRYLGNYNADFIIRDYITFISRKAPSGKSFWAGYDDGPRPWEVKAAVSTWLRRIAKEVGMLVPCGQREAAEDFVKSHRLSVANAFQRRLAKADVVRAMAELFGTVIWHLHLIPSKHSAAGSHRGANVS